MMRELRVAALIKQIPRFEEMRLGADGRLIRDGSSLEVNPYCRRAVSKAIDLAKQYGGRSVVLTMGPPQAAEALKEMLAAGADEAVLITDTAFAGSDTLATARAIAAAIQATGPFDIVLCGLNSVDADTGQVGPEVAELLGLPFVSGARILDLGDGDEVFVGCERDDGWREVIVGLPAVVSVAERLCSPAKAKIETRDAVPDTLIQGLDAASLGVGPWGMEGSPTKVGETRILTCKRDGIRLSGPPEEISEQLLPLLIEREVFKTREDTYIGRVPRSTTRSDQRSVAVVLEPGRRRLSRELLGKAAEIAASRNVQVVAPVFEKADPDELATWGADIVQLAIPTEIEEVAAEMVAAWAARSLPWCLLGPSTSWGREVMGRVAARLGAGLTGDAVELELAGEDLVCWKPAFGGQLVAAITSNSPIQMATIRPGILPILEPREADIAVQYLPILNSSRIRVVKHERTEEVSSLVGARRVVGIGLGVDPEEYWRLDALCDSLGAERAATRKVTDRGWMPRGVQVGITGLSIAPELYIAIGVNGSFNHMVGVRRAGTVVAINTDPSALVFDQADIGIIGDWRTVVPYLVEGLVRLGYGKVTGNSSG